MSFYEDRVFPRLLAWASTILDDDRELLLAAASGRVLELGVGTGANLRFYPSGVTEVVGLDPHPAVLDRAREVAGRMERERELPFGIRIHRADAQRMPYDDASFDTVVSFLTLCTIPDPAAAVRETWRVLRPGGTLLVLEHVAAPIGSGLRRWQRIADPVWSRLAGGCHLDRDTRHVLATAGFDVGVLERYRDQTFFPLMAPRIRGVLRKPDGKGAPIGAP